MPLDPQIEPILAASAGMVAMDWSAMDAQSLRSMMTANQLPKIPVELHGIEDHEVKLGSHHIPLRLYRPSDEENLPVVLYFHGGGWVLGSIDDYDTFCGHLAKRSGCAVLSVDYRLAPEHRYPAALDDCYNALIWIEKNSENLNLDGGRLAVMGDSAGGNLAAAVSLVAKERKGPSIKHQLLVYPATDAGCNNSTFQENDRYFLTPEMMRWYWRQYLGDQPGNDIRLAEPAKFDDLAGLPDATVITAEFDPLREEGECYAQALAAAGVPSELVRVPGVIHGFAAMLGMLDVADKWLDFMGSRLSRALRHR